jgi:hypothetical protein
MSTLRVGSPIDGRQENLRTISHVPRMLRRVSVLCVARGELASLHSIRIEEDSCAVSSSHDIPFSATTATSPAFQDFPTHLENGVVSTWRSTIRCISKPNVLIVLMRLSQRAPASVSCLYSTASPVHFSQPPCMNCSLNPAAAYIHVLYLGVQMYPYNHLPPNPRSPQQC